jgi:DNA gyrase subunit A
VAKRRSEPTLFDLPEQPAGDGQPPSPPGGGGSFSDGNAVPLHEAAQTRYLNYALSVITSRALPDVRDGLKPVQRRILYTMWQQNLTADAKHRKCAKVVGDVMGNYHPHGDAAIYETLVRIAQPFSLRVPLVDGSGNFGSLDGDPPAAMRYTECRLARVSDEMLQEIEQQTVSFRPNYDGTRTEPVVLPARLPNLLVNGATGIAVGMATNIPPHNLNEVCTALIKLLDNQELTSVQLCRYIKGPDFPTGGHILNSPSELKEIYKSGQGSIRLRATWENGPASRSGKTIYITSVPYTVDKAQLVERIGDVVLSRKMPHLLDVKDLSTDDVRIELTLKAGADENLVLAYLFKNTPLQTSFAINMTCLVPIEESDTGRPQRLELREALWHFLHFRLEVVTARLEHELEQLRKRIHIREGFRRARRDHPHHPQVGRQSRRGGEDQQALCARCRAGRRHPRTQAVSTGTARDSRHPERASREAQARPPDHRVAEGRGFPMEARSRGAGRGSEEVRREAPDGHRGNRRSRILRRCLHHRGGQRRHRVA